MRPEEIRALGDLAGGAASGLTRAVRDTHRAISRRAFRAVGPAALPVRLVHDGIAEAVYGFVGSVSRSTLRGGARALSAARRPDASSLQASQTPFLPYVRHLFVSASVVRDPHSRVGRVLGDLVVSRDSAWAHPGDRQPMRFPVESYRQIGGIHHFDLLDHPVVLRQIVDWLRRPELPPGA